MKIVFLAPSNNYHTIKWCKWFLNNGDDVHVISFVDSKIEDINVHYVSCNVNAQSTDLKKILYLFNVKKVKKLLDELKPDIVNAHYATSYGSVMALTRVHPYILSLWGADIYDFPRKSILHRLMLKFSLRKADYIFSTSKAMSREASIYTSKKIYITPFGVDMDLFSPQKRTRKEEKEIIIGTIKSLSPKYGIDILLKAIAQLYHKHPEINFQLRIAGKGFMENEYKILSKDLGINHIIKWLGFIPQSQVAIEWANMDIAVIPSLLDSESFGVSAVEAEASGLPVIVSDIPGLLESTNPGFSSLVVKRNDVDELENAIYQLCINRQVAKNMGIEGRKFVVNNFEINKCFNYIRDLFIEINLSKIN